MMTRRKMVAGVGALAITVAMSAGAFTLVQAQPPSESQKLPTATALAEKMDALNNPQGDARSSSVVSGDGPAPQIIDPRDEIGDKTVVTNTVTDVTEDGPDRAVATRTMKYLFPNGQAVETEPAAVPFVREDDGEWRIDRAYLCGQRKMVDNMLRQSGFDAKPDPGCS